MITTGTQNKSTGTAHKFTEFLPDQCIYLTL